MQSSPEPAAEARERPASLGCADAPTELAGTHPPDGASEDESPGMEQWAPHDIVDEWGVQSFPASDPPANW
jgi:hypothetical protein